ncbi:MAG TPA: carboxypeptidase-like regulatory domain-containing protein, partial [Chitinophagaceae bacterium]
MKCLQLHVRQFLLLSCAFLLSVSALAQTKVIKGYIKDALSNERVPFASINFIKSNDGKLSDSAGNFIFHFSEWPVDTLLVSYVGYQDYKLFISPQLLQRANNGVLNLVIGMERGKTVSEVLVERKIDRGQLMWKRIVKHKKQNDRYRFTNFSYELYNKLELDLNKINPDRMKRVGLLKPFNFVFNNVDTTEGAPFLPVFLTETISDYYYQKSPFRTREIIKGSKTEGVDNESISRLLGGTDANVNVYAN